MTYLSATDAEALAAFQLCAKLEGIIPALEPAHALAKVWTSRQQARGSFAGGEYFGAATRISSPSRIISAAGRRSATVFDVRQDDAQTDKPGPFPT